MVTTELPMENDTIFYYTCMYTYRYQTYMPQSLLVFAVSFTQETPNFGTFGGVANPLEDFLIIF